MAKLAGPRQDTVAFRALCRIVALGGRAKHADLLTVLPAKYHQVGMFRRYIVEVLASYSLVDFDDDGVTMVATKLGRQFCGVDVKAPAAAKYVGEVAAKRVQIVRDLDLSRHRVVAPYRPGADEYINIPSLYTAGVVDKTGVNENGAITRSIVVGHVVRKLPNGEVVKTDV